MSHLKHNEHGFTLVELMMAMAIFSMMLLIITIGVIMLMRIYQNGIASRNTQQNARYGMEQMVRAGRSAYKFSSSGSAGNQRLCFYIANSGQEYYISSGQLIEATLQAPSTPCDGTGIISSHAITSTDVVVTVLNGTLQGQSVTPAADDSLSAQIDLTIGTGNGNGSLDQSTSSCTTGAGAQFCSVTALHSSVTLRGGQGTY